MKRKGLALGVLTFAGWIGFAVPVAVADPSFRVVSNDLEEVGAYVFTQREVNNQSGERIVVDALLYGDTTSANDDAAVLLDKTFSLVVPNGQQGERICVDLASKTASLRRTAVFRLTKSVERIDAHVELGDDIREGGAVMVAFSTRDQSKNPLEACLLQDDWIFPARPNSRLEEGEASVLQLRLNSGNETSTVVQVDANNVAIGKPIVCDRDDGKNGMFDRICRLKLLSTATGIARVKTKLRQRNGLPTERIFNVAVSGRGQ